MTHTIKLENGFDSEEHNFKDSFQCGRHLGREDLSDQQIRYNAF